VLEEQIVASRKSLNPEVAYQVVDMMRSVVDHGTGSVIRRLGFRLPAAGKTGTTNAYRDAWFTGFTATMSCSVWVGYDKDEGLHDRRGIGITGGRGAAPIWAAFMKKASEGEPRREFAIPTNLDMVTVDPITGLPAPENAPGVVEVALRPGQVADGSRLGAPSFGTGPFERPENED
jgi:penicillin-binding protein 1A